MEWLSLRYIVIKEQDGKCQLCGRSRKDWIIVFVSKTRDGDDEKFIITELMIFQKEEAGDAIEAVIAKNSYDPEFVIVKNQVVATTFFSIQFTL